MESIELYLSYQEDLKSFRADCQSTKRTLQPPPLPLLMTAFGRDVETAEEFMAMVLQFLVPFFELSKSLIVFFPFQTLSQIKSSELEETLLVLPLDVVTSLLEIIETLLSKNLYCELVCRTFFFIVEIHFGPLTGAPHLKPLISRVRDLADKRLKVIKYF